MNVTTPNHERVTSNLLTMYKRDDWLMRLNINLYLRAMGILSKPRDTKILDCGCGTGNIMKYLQRYGFTNLQGFDLAPEMVEAARINTGAEIKECSMQTMGQHYPEQSLDLLFCSGIFHHVPSLADWEKVFSAAYTMLRPGGEIIVREPYPNLGYNLLVFMTRFKIFYRGSLNELLTSLKEEEKELDYFFTNWPGRYRKLITGQGFSIARDFNFMTHRITVCRK